MAQTQHPKYRTILCSNYSNAKYCPYGDKCTFIHSDDPSVANSHIVKRETKRKTELCKHWHGPQMTCNYGRKCDFLHDEPRQFYASVLVDNMPFFPPLYLPMSDQTIMSFRDALGSL